MGATFNRVKTWIAETLSASDLNAEIDNVLDNFTPAGMDDYSSNTTEMQTQTDPGEVATESLPTSLAGELARLRHQMAELKGTTYWYTSPVTTLASLNTAFGSGGLPQTRLVSGATTGNSSQSVLLTPEGAGNGNNLVISGATTSLVYRVVGTEYTLTTDVTISSTTAPPTSNNTAAVNDASIGDQDWTKWAGMYETAIPIDAIGSEITSLNGKLAAFKINNGSASEYFFATPDTTNNQLKNVKRGWFYDESGNPIPSVAFADNDTITLMNIAWTFLKTDKTSSVVYNEPVVSAVQPSTPSIGDYWFDLANELWKTYNGATYDDADAVFVGIGIIDENGDCVAARSEDFVKGYFSVNTSEIIKESNTQLKSNKSVRVGIYGSVINMYNDEILWDITSDLDTGAEASSTMYFFYVKEDGTPVISLQAPEDLTNTRGGLYHPHETWRCLAQAWNNSSSNLDRVISYHTDDPGVAHASSSVAANALTLEYWTSPLAKYALYDEVDSNNASTKYSRFPIYQSITVPSTATLGHINSVAVGTVLGTSDHIILHMITSGNYTTLGVSAHQHGQGHLTSTTVLDNTSDDGNLYSATAYTDAQVKAIAHGLSTQTTAGTWATNLNNFKASPFINACRRLFVGISANMTGTAETRLGSGVGFYVTKSRRIRIGLTTATASDTGTSAHIRMEDPTPPANKIEGQLAFFDEAAATRLRTFQFALRADGNGGNDLALALPVSAFRSTLYPEELTAGERSFTLYADGFVAGNEIDAQAVRLFVEELPYDGEL